MNNEIDIGSKHLKIFKIEEKPKTNVYSVQSKFDGFELGQVKWYPNWRQYCFFPAAECVWSVDCLTDLKNFVESENIKRKKVKE
jgi:hypothetical protein